MIFEIPVYKLIIIKSLISKCMNGYAYYNNLASPKQSIYKESCVEHKFRRFKTPYVATTLNINLGMYHDICMTHEVILYRCKYGYTVQF